MEKERKGKEFKERLMETVERIHDLTPESEEDRERLAELCVFSVRKFSEFSPMVALALVAVAPDRKPVECVGILKEHLKDKKFFEEVREVLLLCWKIHNTAETLTQVVMNTAAPSGVAVSTTKKTDEEVN